MRLSFLDRKRNLEVCYFQTRQNLLKRLLLWVGIKLLKVGFIMQLKFRNTASVRATVPNLSLTVYP